MDKRALATTALILALALGCSRSFNGGAPLPTGTPCGPNTICASGVCADGVCCEKTCDSTESCDAVGKAGRCTTRQLGDACDDDTQCPSTHCSDKVCCVSTCNGNCNYCNGPLSPGICTYVPDSQDPRGDCKGTSCFGCFSGTCGPATPGTDPQHECDADAGMACGAAQSCGEINGGPCNQDSDCSSFYCVNSICIDYDLETVDAPLNPSATARDVLQLASDHEGHEALVVDEVQTTSDDSGDVEIIEDSLLLVFHTAGGNWEVLPLASNGSSEYWIHPSLAQVVYQGLSPLVFTWDRGQGCGGTTDCAIHVSRVTLNGVLLDGGSFAPGLQDLDSLQALVESDGALRVEYESGSALHAWKLTPGPDAGWVEDGTLPVGSGDTTFQVQIARIHGQDYFLYLSATQASSGASDGLHLRSLDGTVTSSLPFTDPRLNCDPSGGFFLSAPADIADDDSPQTLALTCYPLNGGATTLYGVVDVVGQDVTWNLNTLNGELPLFEPVLEPSGNWFGAVLADASFNDNVGLSWIQSDGSFTFRTFYTPPSGDGVELVTASGQQGLPLEAFVLKSSSSDGPDVPPTLYLMRYHL